MAKSEDVVEHIYKTWLDEVSPCSECPVYDKRGCRKPFYGHGTINELGEVDIMVIGEAPGPKSQEDTPSDRGQQLSVREFMREKRKDQIYEAFNGNSTYFEYLANTLQENFDDVYFTNLLKCNNLEEQDGNESGSWVDVGRLDDSHDYEYDTEKGLQSEGNLNQKAKEKCSEHLKAEIFTLNPSVVICLGKGHISEVYDMFDIDSPDISTCIETGKKHKVNLTNERSGSEISTTVVPSYHFTGQFFQTNIRNCDFIEENNDASTQRKNYWDRVIEITDSAL